MTLHDVIVRPGLHGLDRDIFADGARHEDERQIPVASPQERQRIASAEPRHREIRDHHVPRLPTQRGGQPGCRLDALPGWIEASPPQLAHQQRRVVVGILDDQDVERPACFNASIAVLH